MSNTLSIPDHSSEDSEAANSLPEIQMPDLQECIRDADDYIYDGIHYLSFWYGNLDPETYGGILFTQRLANGKFKLTGRRTPENNHQNNFDWITSFDDQPNLYIKSSLFDLERVGRRYDNARQSGATVAGKRKEVKTVLGFGVDCDAGKQITNSELFYPPLEYVWEALGRMPVIPSMFVQTGHRDHGGHAYWKLAEPVVIRDLDHVKRINNIAKAWCDLYKRNLANVMRDHGLEPLPKKFLADAAYGVDRVLRPVGAVRASGHTVRLLYLNESLRYAREQLVPPGYEPPQPRVNLETRSNTRETPVTVSSSNSSGDRPIEQYIRQQGCEITVESLLRERWYTNTHGNNWLHPRGRRQQK